MKLKQSIVLKEKKHQESQTMEETLKKNLLIKQQLRHTSHSFLNRTMALKEKPQHRYPQNTGLKLKSVEPDFIQTPEKNIVGHKSERCKTGKIISTQTFLDNKNAGNVNASRRSMLKENFLVNESIEKTTIRESVYQFWNDCSCNCARKKKICCLNFWASISLPQSIRKPFFMFTIVVFTIIKLLWDAADVTIDAYLFYPLEMGEVIDNSIYRNATVNSFILAFSVLGCIKILFWLRIIGLPGNKKSLDNWKLVFIAITFMFEDGPEILLEYFYVEKYISKQIAWYLLVRDVILCIIALYSLVVSLIWLVLFGLQVRRRYQQETIIPSYPALDCTVVVNGGCCLLIGFCNFLRTGGAGYQYVTGMLRRSCFEVFDGALRQTPFTAGCMREVDYFIIVLCGLAIFPSVFSLAITNYIIHVIKKKSKKIYTRSIGTLLKMYYNHSFSIL